MLRLLKARVKMGTLGEFTSAFTQTGVNMSAKPNARREAVALRSTAPAWARGLKPVWIAHHRFRRFVGGMYKQQPFTYEVYTPNSGEHRKRFEVPSPRGYGSGDTSL